MECEINGTKIGPEHSPYMVAELSGNHNGDLDRALELISAAKHAGASAVKIQTYTPETITLDCDRSEFQLTQGLWKGQSLFALYQQAHTPWEWHEAMFRHARDIGVTLFSSPFDPTAVDLLVELGAPAFKIASFEIVDLPLVKYAARHRKPMIISTGMANTEEMAEAVAAVREVSDAPIVLLHCTSAYPAPPDEAHLRTMVDLQQRFDVLVGLSDHTTGIAVPVAAVSLGAVFVEKHFMLSRALGGVDSAFSVEPQEFKAMADACRTAWRALGRVDHSLKPSEIESREYRRSLYVVVDVPAGTELTPEHVRSIRPGRGLLPKHLPDVLGRRAMRDLKRGEPFHWDMIQSTSD